MIKRFALTLLLLCLLSIPLAASTIGIGLISFDVVIPTGASPGVNALATYDFTGPTYGPFGGNSYVVDPLNFVNATLTVYFVGGGSMVEFQGEIFPGELMSGGQPFPTFPSTTEIASAVLTATLSQTTFTLSDGRTFTASPDITVDLAPASGSMLAPGVDFAAIDAQSAGGATPEPGPVALVPFGILGLALWRRR